VGLKLPRESLLLLNRGQTPFSPVPGSSEGGSSLDSALQDQSQLKVELTEVKMILDEEKALHATHHEDLLAVLSALTTKLSLLPPCACSLHISTFFLSPRLH